jgi:hypothetical protein
VFIFLPEPGEEGAATGEVAGTWGYHHLLQWRAAPGKRNPERGLLGCAPVGRTTIRRATAPAVAGSSAATAALRCTLEPTPGLLRGDP